MSFETTVWLTVMQSIGDDEPMQAIFNGLVEAFPGAEVEIEEKRGLRVQITKGGKVGKLLIPTSHIAAWRAVATRLQKPSSNEVLTEISNEIQQHCRETVIIIQDSYQGQSIHEGGTIRVQLDSGQMLFIEPTDLVGKRKAMRTRGEDDDDYVPQRW